VTRHVVVGAGAVGSAIGGLLAHHGSDVLLVARGDHGRALVEHGLTLRCPDTTLHVDVPTVTGPDEARLTTDDVLVLATKTQQAQAALAQWADVPVHGPDGTVAGRAGRLLPVLTALNGVASEEIALRYVTRVYAVCVWFPTVMITPGEVFVRGTPLRGVFHVGRYGRSPCPGDDAALLARLGADWDAAGLRFLTPPDVMAWKYRKLLANTGNVIQALLGDTTGAGDLAAAVGTEAQETLEAAGLAVVGEEESRADWQPPDLSFRQVPGEPEVMGGSTWQSLVRGAGSVETDYLNGEIALIARRIGRTAPLNAGLAALARRAAREGLRPGAFTVADLTAALDG
jgi:2-dehydropantoate 2-reductase